MANALSTVDLLKQCLPIIEDKYLRLRFSDPWSFFIMCTAIMLIKIHLGKESRQTAKSSCARRFLDLYYKNVWIHQPSDLAQQQAITQDIVNQATVSFALAAITLAHLLHCPSLHVVLGQELSLLACLSRLPLPVPHLFQTEALFPLQCGSTTATPT